MRSVVIVERNLPWLLDGDSDGEAELAWWREVIVPSVTHFMSYQDRATFNEIVLDFVGKL